MSARQWQITRRMAPGTFGGRSRVATPAPHPYIPRADRGSSSAGCICSPVSLTESFDKADGALGPDLRWDVDPLVHLGFGAAYQPIVVAGNAATITAAAGDGAYGIATVSPWPFACTPDQSLSVDVASVTSGGTNELKASITMHVRASYVPGDTSISDEVYALVFNIGNTAGYYALTYTVAGSSAPYIGFNNAGPPITAGDTLTLEAIGDGAALKLNGSTVVSGSLAGHVPGTTPSTVGFGMFLISPKVMTLDNFVIDGACP